MTATATRKPTKQQPRTARLHHFGSTTVLGLTGKLTVFYRLESISSDFGTAFRLSKAECGNGPEESYDVLLDGRHSSCTCKGHTLHGHCKHVESLLALAQTGKISLVQRQQPVTQPIELEDL
jgi:hypothetical protein